MSGEYLTLGSEGKKPRGIFSSERKKENMQISCLTSSGRPQSQDLSHLLILRRRHMKINSEQVWKYQSPKKVLINKSRITGLGQGIDNRGQSQQSKWLKRELLQWSKYCTVGFWGGRRGARRMRDYELNKNHYKAATQMLGNPYAESS